MLANGGLYAVKTRKRPVHKSCGLKSDQSNPSKRHRDRLNGELEQLTTLLPFTEEIRARLDKLSVLRLSVAFLKIKQYFYTTLNKSLSAESLCNVGDSKTVMSIDGVSFSEGDLLLHALNGFVMVVSTDGFILYASPTIQDHLGFHQSDVIHQSVFDLIHIDDRNMFRCQLHFALDPNFSTDGEDVSAPESFIPPENSSFLERNFCCRLRCLLNNSSGFLALSFIGRLKYLHRQDQTTPGVTSGLSQLALFAITTPVNPPAILEIRAKTLFFQTKHKLDFTPVGMDTRGKVILGYTEQELCMRGSGYQFVHAADMMYCADKHLHMMKTGESGLTIFRLLSKKRLWIWVQSNARMVFKAGKPDFIICRQKPLTNEEGEEHLYQRQLQLPFSFTTGEALLYETFPSLMTPQNHPSQPFPKSDTIHPDSLLGSFLRQDRSVYQQPVSTLSVEQIFLDSHALLSVPSKPWSEDVLADSIRQDSLTESLGNGDQEELKEIERVLLELKHNPIQLGDILANDVFSYVEDALLRESSQSMSGDVDINCHSQHHDRLLPSNQIRKYQISGESDLRTIYYGQNIADGVERNEPQDCFMYQHSNKTAGTSHNNHCFSVQKVHGVSDSSQNTQHPLHPDVPERPFFINNGDPDQRGVLPSWQQQHHVVPLTLPIAPQRSDCITQNPSVTQHPQDGHTQTEPYGGLSLYPRIHQ